MPTYECLCGAKYRFSEAHLGRKSQCKKCGAVFTLAHAGDSIPLAAQPQSDCDIDSVTARRAGVSPTVLPPTTPPGAEVILEKERDEPAKGPSGYWQSLLWSFLFAAQPGDLVVFLLICGILSFFEGVFGFSGFFMFTGGIFFLIPWFIYKGWYASVRFSILQSAAAGEESLPSFNASGDWVGEYLVPAVQWAGSWVVVTLPVVLFGTLFISSTGLTLSEALGLGFGGPAPISVMASDVGFWVAIGVGLFMWPMVILCIALGGFSTVFRIDLMLISIIRTFPVYALTVAIVFGCELGGFLLQGAIYSAVAPVTATGGIAPIGDRMIAACASNTAYVYATIVMLRAIGLYYHHFRHRFAWSWG